MFKDCDTISDEIMIYRSPMLFDHVYAYLLDDAYPYPKKYYAELDYYLIDKPVRCAGMTCNVGRYGSSYNPVNKSCKFACSPRQ